MDQFVKEPEMFRLFSSYAWHRPIPANANNISCFHMLDLTITSPNEIGLSVWLTFYSACWCTLHLSPPAGWEGWGLHQPPWVQNRPSHRVQAEIVSLHHMLPELLIKHICYLPHNVSMHTSLPCILKNTNQSPCLTAVPSKPVIPKSRASSSPQIVLRKWTGECCCEPRHEQQLGTVDVTCLWVNVSAVKNTLTQGNIPAMQHYAWIR